MTKETAGDEREFRVTSPGRETGAEARTPRQRLGCRALPVLTAQHSTLRQLEPGDAVSLATLLGTSSIQEFLPVTPTTPQAFIRYIRWARRQQRSGRHLSFGVVPHGQRWAVGVIQIWPIESQFWTAEWGFALGQPYWGTGLFAEAAEQVLNFAIHTLGIHRVEARSAADNARGNRALEKLGAVREGLLRQCFDCEGRYRDHWMWAIIKDEWSRRHPEPTRGLEEPTHRAISLGATHHGRSARAAQPPSVENLAMARQVPTSASPVWEVPSCMVA